MILKTKLLSSLEKVVMIVVVLRVVLAVETERLDVAVGIAVLRSLDHEVVAVLETLVARAHSMRRAQRA